MQGLTTRALHWKSTGAGVAASALVYYLLTSLGCHLPSDWSTWAITILPGVFGVLSKG